MSQAPSGVYVVTGTVTRSDGLTASFSDTVNITTRTVTLGLVTEKPVLYGIVNGRSVELGLVTETPTIYPIQPINPITVNLGLVTEAPVIYDIAAIAPKTVNLGLVTESPTLYNIAASTPALLTVTNPPLSNVKINELVTVGIDGDGTETLENALGTVAVVSNDGSTLTFNAIDIHTFGDKSLNYYSAITHTLTRDVQSVDFTLIIEPEDNTLFGQITSIAPGGLYENDQGALNSYAHIKNITPGITINVNDGSYTALNSGSADVALYDTQWSEYVTETVVVLAQPIQIAFTTANESATAQGLALDTVSTQPINIAFGTALDTTTANNLDLVTAAIQHVSVSFAPALETATANPSFIHTLGVLAFPTAVSANLAYPFSFGAQDDADTNAPVITLQGPISMVMRQGAVYRDPGYEAYDIEDKEITPWVVVTSSLDVDVPGTYQVRYRVADRAGNSSATVTRSVTVLSELASALSLAASLPVSPVSIAVGSSYSLAQFVNNPSNSPLIYSVKYGTLPDTLRLDPYTGLVTAIEPGTLTDAITFDVSFR